MSATHQRAASQTTITSPCISIGVGGAISFWLWLWSQACFAQLMGLYGCQLRRPHLVGPDQYPNACSRLLCMRSSGPYAGPFGSCVAQQAGELAIRARLQRWIVLVSGETFPQCVGLRGGETLPQTHTLRKCFARMHSHSS